MKRIFSSNTHEKTFEIAEKLGKTAKKGDIFALYGDLGSGKTVMAKGIASGFPMGALLAREGLEFKKSEHGSTFAGGPLACAAALATLQVIEEILPSISGKGERFRTNLSKYNPRVRGLMIGMTVGDRCGAVQKQCAERGLLVNCAADGNLRLVPPLVISDEEIDQACTIIREALG